ncbi:hypothetical protein AVEN_192807-1 [Araneus ventricosus]|uniref:Uncharacterized protein n=1 Tax=Araneus ventricosus TaxID=182803 RepID=A0A4Y2SR88_ARAVE|nr:hypothetical protein AVEN_192807-1 [Araneus ventricosus]
MVKFHILYNILSVQSPSIAVGLFECVKRLEMCDVPFVMCLHVSQNSERHTEVILPCQHITSVQSPSIAVGLFECVSLNRLEMCDVLFAMCLHVRKFEKTHGEAILLLQHITLVQSYQLVVWSF